MSVRESRLDDRVALVAQTLEDAKVPFAIGGAIALAYYGEPRATVDLDVNIFLGVEKRSTVLRLVGALGVETSPKASETLKRDGQVRLRWPPFILDLFFSVDAFHESCASRIQRVPFLEQDIPILSAEDLIVFKILYNRRKDWLDIEQVLFARAGAFDIGYVEEWLDRLVGPDDERRTKLSEAIANISGPSPTD